MRCPYPDCQFEFFDSDIWVDVFSRCPQCQRLTWNCVRDSCQASNRLLSRFCRRCGKPAREATPGIESGQRWHAAGRFSDTWLFEHPAPQVDFPVSRPNPGASEAASDNASVQWPKVTRMLDLAGKAKGFQTPNVLMEMALEEGLLAIHQGGGSLLLINAFGDQNSPSLVIWDDHEANILGGQTPATTDGRFFRPYLPTLSSGKRFRIFSTAYCCIALDQWSLPGWTTGSTRTIPSIVFSKTEIDGTHLADKPIPLGGPDDDLGLIFRDREGNYFWTVVPLMRLPNDSNVDSPPPIRTPTEISGLNEFASARTVKLPIDGAPCQIVCLENSVLAIATPVGHWIWNVESARLGRVDTLQRLRNPPDKGDEFRLDAHVENRAAMHFPRQLVTCEVDFQRRPERLSWHYSMNEDRSLEMYNVALNRDPIEITRPKRSRISSKAEPMGFRLRGSHVETLYRNEGLFYKRDDNQNDLVLIPDVSLNSGQVIGSRFDSPLLLAVSIEESGSRRIDLLTFSTDLSGDFDVSGSNSPIPSNTLQLEATSVRKSQAVFARTEPRLFTLRELQLLAMPVVWSRWLFTCERERGGCYLVRRELPVVSERPKEGE